MTDIPSWKSCTHALGDLDIGSESDSTSKLVKTIFQESESDRLLREHGFHRFYYCKSLDLVNLHVYLLDRILIEGKKSPVAQLFHLNISDNYKEVSSLDLFGNDKSHLLSMIDGGLLMCTHCRFYKSKPITD